MCSIIFRLTQQEVLVQAVVQLSLHFQVCQYSYVDSATMAIRPGNCVPSATSAVLLNFDAPGRAVIIHYKNSIDYYV